MPDTCVSLIVPPRLDFLEVIGAGVNRYGALVGLSRKSTNMLVQSVLEACEAIIQHAGVERIDDRVELRLDSRDSAVIVEIEYSGRVRLEPQRIKGYSPPRPDQDSASMDLDALRLHIIKHEMDRVQFLVKGSRRILRMVLYRRGEGNEKLAWIMGLAPKLGDRTILYLSDPDAQRPTGVLQRPGETSVLRLDPGETFLVRRMDGKTSLYDIYLDYVSEFGLIAPESLEDLYKKLETLNMLASSDPEARRGFRRAVRAIVNPCVSIPRADAVVSAVHATMRFMFNWFGAVLLLGVGLSGMIPLFEHWARFKTVLAGLEEYLLHNPLVGAGLYLAVFTHVALHELGHGTTCKHFGGMVPRMGVMFYLASFIFFCDTTASLNFTSKRQRILVSLGGPLVSVAVFGAGLWGAGHWSGTDSVWEKFFVGLSLFNLIVLVMNFNPLLKMDAYYMLLDLTGISNLRERSFRFLRQKALAAFGAADPRDAEYTPRERLFFWWYGVLGGAMTIAFMIFPFIALFFHFKTHSLYEGNVFLLLFIIAIMVMRFCFVAFQRIKSVRNRKYIIQ